MFLATRLLLGSEETCEATSGSCSSSASTSHLSRGMKVTSVQLAGCNTDCGRLEVKIEGSSEWLAVCSNTWSMKEASVVCKQLGFSTTLGAPVNYKKGSSNVERLDINCDGSEKSISECQIEKGTGECESEGVIGAYCSTTSTEENIDEKEKTKSLIENMIQNSNERSEKISSMWHLDENSDISDCEILPDVPLPFSTEYVSEAFVFADDVSTNYIEMDRKLRLNLCNPVEERGLKIQKILQKMVESGLRWNVLGMDFSELLKKENSDIKNEYYDLIHELYFKFNDHDLLPNKI